MSGRDIVKEKVFEIVAERLGKKKEELTEPMTFVTDLAADSLDQVELIMELEEKFDLNIPEEEAKAIETIGDAIKYIEEHTQ